MTHLFREQLKGWSCGLVDMATACEAILADPLPYGCQLLHFRFSSLPMYHGKHRRRPKGLNPYIHMENPEETPES